MLIVGFDQSSISLDSQIVHDMQNYTLGGVILFDKEYTNKTQTKNIISPTQLTQLTHDLQKFSAQPLFIGIDQNH